MAKENACTKNKTHQRMSNFSLVDGTQQDQKGRIWKEGNDKKKPGFFSPSSARKKMVKKNAKKKEGWVARKEKKLGNRDQPKKTGVCKNINRKMET